MAVDDFHVEPHTHDGTETEHCHLSAKYEEYIKIHLDDLKSKCDHITVCINKLLTQQSPISVLKGENLGLDKICQSININANNSTQSMPQGKCSVLGRLDIRDDVESHLRDKLEKRDSWDEVGVCLENNYGDDERSTYVKEICGMVDNKREFCTYEIHKHVEKFVNEQIEHLHCTCKSLHKHDDHSHMSTPMMIGIGLGGFVLLLLIIGLVIFCCRRRKNKKGKKKPKVIYLPAPNSDSYPVYQEIFDQRSPPVSPPSLPSRYGSRPLPGMPPEEAEYLEPVQASNSYRNKAPPPLINNPGYHVEAPPEYTETDRIYEAAVMIDDESNAYFEPIVTPKDKNTAGYDTLEQDARDKTDHPEQYEPLEDVNTVNVNKPLGPVPAKRKKKDDRETESEYFELEQVQTGEEDEGEEDEGKEEEGEGEEGEGKGEEEEEDEGEEGEQQQLHKGEEEKKS